MLDRGRAWNSEQTQMRNRINISSLSNAGHIKWEMKKVLWFQTLGEIAPYTSEWSMQALVRVQARVRARRVQLVQSSDKIKENASKKHDNKYIHGVKLSWINSGNGV